VTPRDPSTTRVVLPGSAAFAHGVRALPGHAITEVRLPRHSSLEAGLHRLASLLSDRRLAVDSVVGLELRSPRTLDSQGFADFNSDYRSLLAQFGLTSGNGNPVSRTNAVPSTTPPTQVELVAAQVILPSPGSPGGDFVVSGAAELAPDGSIIAEGDEGPEGLGRKASFVVQVLCDRLASLEASAPNRINIYYPETIEGIADLTLDGLHAEEGAAVCHWHCLPPIKGPIFEVDCRRLSGQEFLYA
jgi:hypothetical protein